MGPLRRVVPCLGLALLAACQVCEDGPRPRAVSGQPAGARCRDGGECAPGLACLQDLCTADCSGAPGDCPAGTRCQGGSLCLPPCAADGDCDLGDTVGACVAASAAGPGYCFPVSCTDDAPCGPDGRCVGYSDARGITWQDSCATGWCQRRP